MICRCNCYASNCFRHLYLQHYVVQFSTATPAMPEFAPCEQQGEEECKNLSIVWWVSKPTSHTEPYSLQYYRHELLSAVTSKRLRLKTWMRARCWLPPVLPPMLFTGCALADSRLSCLRCPQKCATNLTRAVKNSTKAICWAQDALACIIPAN